MHKPSYIIGIDLGATVVKIALFKRGLKRLILKETFFTKGYPSQELLFDKLVNSINRLISSCLIKKSDILGVGIGVPGPVNSQRGLVYYFPNIPGWKNFPLKEKLEQKLGLKVFVENDVKLMALAELKFGQARGVKNCVCLTLGTGVGGALILNGSLFRGSSFVAGEIGHLSIDWNGPNCNCGSRGCLEAFIGNKQILRNARKLFGRDISLEEISRLAKQGNKKAGKIWQDMGFKLGIALSGLVNVFNPEKIVIGGGLANAGSILFKSVRSTVKQRAMRPHSKVVSITKSSLGYNAPLVGASVLVAVSLFKDLN
jgi:glucokinase